MLVVRGRCVGPSRFCLRANGILEFLLWNWSSAGRPYLVYKERDEATGGGDPVFVWFEESCVYTDFCQCHFLGGRSWHHLGAFCCNIVSRRHQFVGHCDCTRDQWYYPHGCNRNTMDVDIAIKLARVAIDVLGDVPPVVPQVMLH